MERLQEAIARAKAERRGDIGKLPNFDHRMGADGSINRLYSPRVVRRRRQPPPDHIEYSRTRRVRLDPVWLEKSRVIAGQHDDIRVEAYRQLRTQVLQTFEQQGWMNLAITSPLQNAGKTLTAVNLAIALSHTVNHTVLLVDLDLTEPDVHQTMGVSVEKGIIDIIEGHAEIEDVLFNPSMPRLCVLPGRRSGQPSSEILSSPAMRNLLRDVTSRYESRIVIFDLPPLLRNDDALLFTPYADATLLVVEDGVNTPDEIERSLHLMKNANFIGTILNKARD